MSNYMIFADTSLDMSRELAEKYDIHFVPMRYELGGENFVCSGLESSEFMQSYYEKQKAGAVTHTSQVGPALYQEVFFPHLQRGTDILYLCLSSGLSGTYQSALMAGMDMEDCPGKLYAVDSLAASAGLGLLAELAAENREKGLSAEENAAHLEQMRLKTCHHILVDDLMYLQRGGRVSSATAVVGSMLNIKPLLRVDEGGSLETIAKRRGLMASWKDMISTWLANRDCSMGKVVYVPHANCLAQAQQLKELILQSDAEAEVRIVPLNPVIGAHTGPGMMAMAYWGTR